MLVIFLLFLCNQQNIFLHFFPELYKYNFSGDVRRGPSPRPSPARDHRVEARRGEIAGEEHIYGHEVGVFCLVYFSLAWVLSISICFSCHLSCNVL